MEVRTQELYEWEALTADQLPRLRQLTAWVDGQEVGKVKLAERPICEAELVKAYPNTPMVYQLFVSEEPVACMKNVATSI